MSVSRLIEIYFCAKKEQDTRMAFLADIENLPIKTVDRTPIYIHDVAHVRELHRCS